MVPKKRRVASASQRPRTQRVVERDVLPEVLPDLPGTRAACGDVCGACLLVVEKDVQIGLLDNCSHLFHFECAERWSRTENTCPQCKQRFFWMAAYSASGKRQSLTRVERRDQEGEEDDDYEDIQVCERCKQVGDEGALLLCDGMHGTCNAAYHLGCVGLSAIPRGSWFCPDCCERGFDTDAKGRRGSQRPAAASSYAGADGGEAPPSPPGGAGEGSPRGGAPAPPAAAAAPAAGSASPEAAASPDGEAGTADTDGPGGATGRGGGGRAAGSRGRARGSLPSQLRVSALACITAPVEVPNFRPFSANASGSGEAEGGLFASFVQRRRALKAASAGAPGGAGAADPAASFIKLNPSYEQDFMGGREASP